MLTQNSDTWPLIEFYWNQNPPDSAHIRSYNNFLAKIPPLVAKEIVYGNLKVSMKDAKFIEPNMKVDGKSEKVFPSYLISEKGSYESETTCTFSFEWKGKLIKEESGITIGMIPVMVGSELCNLVNNPTPKDIDNPSEKTKRWIKMMEMEFKTGLGGWFVKDGTSRVITFQERNKFNEPMIFDLTQNMSKNKKYNYIVEVRNSVTDENTTSILAVNYDKHDEIWCTMKYLDDKKEVAPFLFFYAMGYSDPAQIISFIFHKGDPLLKLTCVKLMVQKMFEQAAKYDWKDELSTLGIQVVDNKDEYIEMIIKTKFLHHYSTKKKKAIYFGYILYCLLSAAVPENIKKENPHIKFVKEEDRDHFGKKVLNTESVLFSNVFYIAIRKMLDSMEKNIASALKDKSEELSLSIVKDMNAKMIFTELDITKMPITMMLSKALTNNMWGKTKRDGVSTVFDPINYNNAVVLLMRSCIPLKSFIGNLDPRMVHGSYFGYIDLFDTPEGDHIGYNKVLSTSSYISSEIDTDIITAIKKYIDSQAIGLGKQGFNVALKKILMDNEWIASATKEKCLEIYDNLIFKKRNGQIDPTISIVWNSVKDELHIYSQEGRLLRPFLIVEDGKILLKKEDLTKYPTWEDVCGSGKVEMLDVNEFEYVKLYCVQINEFMKYPMEVRKQYSHVDIHPATMLGPGAGSIACPHMTQGPRNSYGANMARQAIGTTTRFDMPRMLFYPQRPLVRNKIATILLHYDDYPAGMNVQVALMPSGGFEQEDGITINKHFLELGGFMTNKTTKHIITIDGDDEKIEIPDEKDCFKFKPKNLSYIDSNGIIKKGSPVRMNDPLCCKTIAEVNGNYKKTDCTLFHTEETICWVQDVIVSEKGHKNSKIVKIVLQETRLGKFGNKFSPRQAQKGTCTNICNSEDMPFDPVTRTTLTVIVNPLCIPSRMTINYLHEIFLGEYVCLPNKNGTDYDNPGYENCTPYDDDPLEQYKRVEKSLLRMGWRRDGKKTLTDGATGEIIETDIFCGHVHMQTLRHMVDDKIAKRATGPVDQLMRCPTEGRSKNGGVKTGTMEKDTLAANDCPEILMDRFCLSSDKINTFVCKHCGVIESHNKSGESKCKGCKTANSMVPITMSNSPKVVFSELMACLMIPRILVGQK